MKIIKLLACLYILPSLAYGAPKALPIFDFKAGMVDEFSPERIADNASPDMANVVLDEDSGVVKKKGCSKFNATAFTGSQPVVYQFFYRKNDGSQYIIAQSSSSLFSLTSNGSWTNIKQGLDSSLQQCVSAKDYVYGGNGVDNEWSFNGSTFTEYTVLNSTNMVKAKYRCWWKNYMFRAGVTGNLSTVYYSELSDIQNMGTGLNFFIVSQDDGDYITGLTASADGNSLLILKRYSTWKLTGSYPSGWTLKCVARDIGCLYGTSIVSIGGYNAWISQRGFDAFDGEAYKLLSLPIDNQFRSLPQMQVGQSYWTQTTAADWGSGSGTNIDTVTYSGSVAISTITTPFTLTENTTRNSEVTDYRLAQTFYSTYTVTVWGCKIQISQWGSSGAIRVGIADNSYNFISRSDVVVNNAGGAWGTFVVSFSSTTLTAGTTYTILIDNIYNLASPCRFGISNTSTYSSGTLYHNSSISGGSWVQFGSNYDLSFSVYGTKYLYDTSSFASQSKQASLWGSWGTFNVNDTIPSGSGITYYAKTSTASDNFSTRPFIPITNGLSINSSTGPYIQIISSFTRTDATAVPKLNEFYVSYSASSNNVPKAVNYKDALYVSVSTDSNTGINNCIYKFNKNNGWELMNNIYADSFLVLNNDLLYGSSDDKGQIYTDEVNNLYTRDGNTYTSQYTTKIFDCGSPAINKVFKSLYVSANSDVGNVTISYRLNGYGTWTDLTVPLTGNGLISHKINFPQALTGKYIQFKISGTDYFNVRGLTLIYEETPLI